MTHFTIATLHALLAQEDVEGFIEAGAPVDEYDDEAAQIVSALVQLDRKQWTQDNIRAIVALVWIKNFELSEQEMMLRVPALERIARLIEQL